MWQYSEIRMDRKRTQKIDELRGIFKVLQLLSWILNTFMFLFWVSYICKKAHVHADLWRLWLGVHALLNWSEALSTSISTYWSWLSSHWYYALCSCYHNMSYQLHQIDGSCWPNSSYSKYSLETCPSPPWFHLFMRFSSDSWSVESCKSLLPILPIMIKFEDYSIYSRHVL